MVTYSHILSYIHASDLRVRFIFEKDRTAFDTLCACEYWWFCVQVVGYMLVKPRGGSDDGNIGNLKGGMGWWGGDILAY